MEDYTLTFSIDGKVLGFQIHMKGEMNYKKEHFDLLLNIFALNLHFHKYQM